MSKHPHHHAYPEGSTDLAVAALLTVWSSLGEGRQGLMGRGHTQGVEVLIRHLALHD